MSEYKDGPQRAERGDRPERAPREHKEFGPSKWFSVDVGREGKAEARWLLPMICKAGGITKNEIGAIRIQPNETFVEISEPAVAGFLKAVGGDMKLENQANLTALDSAPQLGERGPRKTKRDYDDRPKRDFGDKPKRDYGDKPKRDYGDKPKRVFGEKPKRAAPRDRGAPPPSAQHDVPPIQAIPGAADDYTARKPRHKPERRDHGDALVAKKGKAPYKAKSDGGKPAYKGKSDGAKPAYKGKSTGGKPAFKGKSDGGKPRSTANDTSKRFTPPGGKAKPRKGGNAAPRKPRG